MKLIHVFKHLWTLWKWHRWCKCIQAFIMSWKIRETSYSLFACWKTTIAIWDSLGYPNIIRWQWKLIDTLESNHSKVLVHLQRYMGQPNEPFRMQLPNPRVHLNLHDYNIGTDLWYKVSELPLSQRTSIQVSGLSI